MAKDNKLVSNAKPALNSNNNDGKICAILAYLLIGIIWYFADEKLKKNNFTKYHTKQAIVLFIVEIVFIIAAAILGKIFVLIPIIGLILITLIWYLIIIGSLVLCVLGIINAINEVEKPLPVIGYLSDKLPF